MEPQDESLARELGGAAERDDDPQADGSAEIAHVLRHHDRGGRVGDG